MYACIRSVTVSIVMLLLRIFFCDSLSPDLPSSDNDLESISLLGSRFRIHSSFLIVIFLFKHLRLFHFFSCDSEEIGSTMKLFLSGIKCSRDIEYSWFVYIVWIIVSNGPCHFGNG